MKVKSNHMVLIFLMACLNFSNASGQDLTVINAAKKPVASKGIVTLREVVVLEASKDCFFGEISCVVTTNSGYYILDNRQANAVYKFDRTGKFCLKFGNPGKGPGEYVHPVWIAADEASEQLIIYDPSIHKLLVYNTKTAEFVKAIGLEINARSFEILKDNAGFIFYCGFLFGGYSVKSQLIEKGKYYQVIITDHAGKITALQLPYPNSFNPQNFIGMTEIFSVSGKETSLFSPFNDTLYFVSEGGKIRPRYVIDYGNDNQQLSTKFMNNIGPMPTDFNRNNQLRASSGIYQLAEQLQTNSHIHLTGIRNKSLYRFLVDKKSLNVIDLVHNNQTFNFGFRASDENCYYSIAVTEAFKKPGDPSFNEYPASLRNALKKAEKNSNPIVLVWEISSF